ncbi:MAG TPA: dienelactone hydrolase family protein [Methylomirabilota bacterium]|nr:dienelactone hydrolase family protein [Methylomirabilota bacterium]
MAQWDRLDVDGSPMRLYVGMPSLGRAFPAVIVIHHGPGVDKFIEDRVENLAQQGYLAIAPDLYHRQTSAAADASSAAAGVSADADMMTRIGRLRDPEVIADVNAAVNYARRLKDTQLGDVGIIGFCMGGRVAYLMAASKPVFKAAGVFYGGNIMKAWGNGPTPFDLTPYIHCPIAGFFGADDANPSPADVDRISAQLDKYRKAHEFHRYPDAGHAFLNFTNPATYRDGPARDAWDKLIPFLQRNLQTSRQPRQRLT